MCSGWQIGKHPSNWKGYLKRSSDDGQTWGEQEYLGKGIVGPAKNKPVELADGTLLAGTSDEGGSDGERRVCLVVCVFVCMCECVCVWGVCAWEKVL
jgi:hypothetical protein